jgi:hypothetical protein
VHTQHKPLKQVRHQWQQMTQPLHTSQLLKPGKHMYHIQTKAHAHPHTPWNTRSQGKKPRWQLVTQLLTDQNTHGFNSCEVCSGWVTYCHRCLTCLKGLCCVCTQVSGSAVSNWPLCEFWTCVLWFFGIYILFLNFLRHQTDKVQKYNSFNTNTPSSESYRNYSGLVK